MAKLKVCSVCSALIEREDAPVISLGIGEPRFICDRCEEDFITATTSRDTDEIGAAMDRIGRKLADSDADRGTFKAVNNILTDAAARATAIKEGTYDFALDSEENGEELTEIPEELLETEEDRLLDAEDEKKNAKFNKIFDIVAYSAFGVVMIYIIWRLLDAYIF